MSDARFEDGGEKPVRLRAESVDDLSILSALLQDAVSASAEISWLPAKRRFVALVNRFRWEDAERAKDTGRPYERTRALLIIDSATGVRASGVDPKDKALVVSILALEFTPGADGAGVLRLILAGDGEIAVSVECLDVTLSDVTRPYAAPSGQAPAHPDKP